MTRLQTDSLCLAYAGRYVLTACTLDFEPGQVVALAGPNGAGKSSLLKLLGGLLEPANGWVRIDKRPLGDFSPRERAQRVAYLPPDGRSAWPMTVSRIVALGRAPFLQPLRSFGDADHEAIDSALERAGVCHLKDRSFATLSSGERARVLLARTLCTGADILLLDEPTAALDPKHQLKVMEIARAEAERGALVIIAMHALDLMARYADRIILLQDGEIVAVGPPEDSLGEDRLRAVFDVEAPGGVAPTPLRPIDVD